MSEPHTVQQPSTTHAVTASLYGPGPGKIAPCPAGGSHTGATQLGNFPSLGGWNVRGTDGGVASGGWFGSGRL
jgi:hypothetical protein